MALTQFKVNLPEELAHAVRITARVHDVSLQEYVREVFIAAVTADTENTMALMADMRKRLNATQARNADLVDV